MDGLVPELVLVDEPVPVEPLDPVPPPFVAFVVPPELVPLVPVEELPEGSELVVAAGVPVPVVLEGSLPIDAGVVVVSAGVVEPEVGLVPVTAAPTVGVEEGAVDEDVGVDVEAGVELELLLWGIEASSSGGALGGGLE